MAVHKFLTNKEGGYFYRHYPKIRTGQYPLRDPLARLLLFADPPEPATIRSESPFLYGIFLTKYNDKGGLTIELMVSGDIVLTDYCTQTQERRELTSILIIQVPDEIYKYPFKDDTIYKVTPIAVTEIIPK